MTDNTTLSEKIQYGLLYGTCWTVSKLPHWFLYDVLLDIIYLLLYRVARYRIKVVRENLSNAFPEKSTRELRRIERGFYYQLAEIFIDVVDFASITHDELRRRLQIENLDQHIAETAGKNVVNMMAHYGDWEYGGVYSLYDRTCRAIGVYHPLHNKAFDRYYKTIREKSLGMITVPMKSLPMFFLRNKEGIDGCSLSLGMIADQNPWGDKRNRWMKFLNQPTRFYLGSAKIALHYGLPVYYVDIIKNKRTHYTARFVQIYDGIEPVDELTITERYANLLEQTIRRRPELWMWSHRRWKRKPSAEELAEYKQRYSLD